MGYYLAGDYYRGDYYRGDSIFKKFGKALGKAAGAVFAATPAGKAFNVVRSLVGSGGHKSLPRPNVTPLIDYSGGGFDVDVPPSMNISNYPVSSSSENGSAEMIPAFQRGQLPTRGYHLNKSTYETRGGGTSRWPRSLQVHEKGTVLVRNRRMNVGNARALKRALRRAGGFARLARRVMSFTHPRAGRGRFKTTKRARR